MMRGALIVFEGCDRSGKTTQCKKLVDALNSENIPATFMNFPGKLSFYLLFIILNLYGINYL